MPDDQDPPELSTILDETREDRAILRVEGEIDLLTAPRLEEALEAALRPGRLVVVDLNAVTFMDSTGLRTLLQAHRGAAGTGGGLAIDAAPGGAAARLLDLAGVRGLFLDDVEEASGA
jgi:anti-sigma B factor antagonist